MSVCVGVFAVAACTRTTDRVLEPVGGGDASTSTPEVGDASLTPIGPIAHPDSPASPAREDGQEREQPAEDFRLARSPELGLGLRAEVVQFVGTRPIRADNGLPGQGGAAGNAGNGGNAGSGRGRPVSTGGAAYF